MLRGLQATIKAALAELTAVEAALAVTSDRVAQMAAALASYDAIEAAIPMSCLTPSTHVHAFPPKSNSKFSQDRPSNVQR